ncbi:hypothetical protein GQ55_4G144900 [Panicum hallii var. hallii]|uniref:Uncharacterized protein n=1 Tax=Panicum hallii var. hallii TaxID=1504633 RepID=A0A2T7DYC0_9POAL|nr:hypothetical protein GQ55_4G144900 [Panicum hallii var. hallii]
MNLHVKRKLAPVGAIEDNRAPRNGYGTRPTKRSHGLAEGLTLTISSLFSVFFITEREGGGKKQAAPAACGRAGALTRGEPRARKETRRGPRAREGGGAARAGPRGRAEAARRGAWPRGASGTAGSSADLAPAGGARRTPAGEAARGRGEAAGGPAKAWRRVASQGLRAVRKKRREREEEEKGVELLRRPAVEVHRQLAGGSPATAGWGPKSLGCDSNSTLLQCHKGADMVLYKSA